MKHESLIGFDVDITSSSEAMVGSPHEIPGQSVNTPILCLKNYSIPRGWIERAQQMVMLFLDSSCSGFGNFFLKIL